MKHFTMCITFTHSRPHPLSSVDRWHHLVRFAVITSNGVASRRPPPPCDTIFISGTPNLHCLILCGDSTLKVYETEPNGLVSAFSEFDS